MHFLPQGRKYSLQGSYIQEELLFLKFLLIEGNVPSGYLLHTVGMLYSFRIFTQAMKHFIPNSYTRQEVYNSVPIDMLGNVPSTFPKNQLSIFLSRFATHNEGNVFITPLPHRYNNTFFFKTALLNYVKPMYTNLYTKK